MAIILESLTALPSQPENVFMVLLVLFGLMALSPLMSRRSSPKRAPILSMRAFGFQNPSFSKGRAEYLQTGKRQSQDGQFSFWHGTNHVVAVSGHSSRSSYMTSRGLDPVSGYAYRSFLFKFLH